MATTLDQLRIRARQKADMVGSTFVTDAELTTYVNAGLAELYDMVVGAFEDYFTVSSTLTVGAGSTTATLPVDFYKLRGLDYNNNGSYELVREFQFNERNDTQARNLYWRRNSSIGRKYRVMGDNLLLQPDGAAAGTYRLWYVPAPTILVNPTDLIPNSLSKFGWDEYVALYAAERMLLKEETDASGLVRQRNEIAGRITQMAADRQADQSETIQMVRDDWDDY